MTPKLLVHLHDDSHSSRHVYLQKWKTSPLTFKQVHDKVLEKALSMKIPFSLADYEIRIANHFQVLYAHLMSYG